MRNSAQDMRPVRTGPPEEGPKPPPVPPQILSQVYADKRARRAGKDTFSVKVKCARCSAVYPIGICFCLDFRCGAPLNREAVSNIGAVTAGDAEKRQFWLSYYGLKMGTKKKPDGGKPRKQLSRDDMKHKERAANRDKCTCHAHRYDTKWRYMNQQMEAGVPRAVEVCKTEPGTGKRTNEYYFYDEKYLREHKWEDSINYKLLYSLMTNPSNLAPLLPDVHGFDEIVRLQEMEARRADAEAEAEDEPPVTGGSSGSGAPRAPA